MHQQLLILLVGAYLLGSVPFGLIAGKLRGIDIREHGSKNIGATNAGRVLGGKYFWLVFLLDLAKGLGPMLLASVLVGRVPEEERSRLTYLLWIGVGAVAMLGHVFPVYLGFKGGKGVATSLGVVLGLWPYFTLAGAVALALFVLVLLATRYVSAGSVVAAVGFPVVYTLIGRSRGWDVLGDQLPLLLVSSLLAAVIVIRHRTNLGRLWAGTEHKVGRRSPEG